MIDNKYKAFNLTQLLIIAAIGIVVSLNSVTVFAQNNKRITKVSLIAGLKNCKERRNCTACTQCRLTAPDFIKSIQRLKVSFQLQDSDIPEVRQAADFLEVKETDTLIAAIRDNYLPRASVPYSGVDLTEEIARQIREMNTRSAQQTNSKLPKAIAELVKLLTQLSARKYSISNGLSNYLVHGRGMGYELGVYLQGDFENANKILLDILKVIEEIDPEWSANNVDKSILSYKVIYDKQRLMFAKKEELGKGSLTEAQIRTMAEDFQDEAEILEKLTKELAVPTP